MPGGIVFPTPAYIMNNVIIMLLSIHTSTSELASCEVDRHTADIMWRHWVRWEPLRVSCYLLTAPAYYSIHNCYQALDQNYNPCVTSSGI